MNFKFVNPHHVRWLVPSWAGNPFEVAAELEDMMAEAPIGFRNRKWNTRREFWLEIDLISSPQRIRMGLPQDEVTQGLCGNLVIRANEFDIKLPLNYMMKGAIPIEGKNLLYYHSFRTECPLGYFGVTKHHWYERLAQHKSSARSGSPLLFHRAIREHAAKRAVHTIAMAGLERDEIMHWEEDYVRRMSLYPLGLNMIPGGYAGIRYLQSIGFPHANADNRDALLEDIVTRPSFAGRPNPLCAARWETDQDFVNRIVCGHSGRLTLADVRNIRMMDLAGRCVGEIAKWMGAAEKRVIQVIRGKTYSRVA